MNLKIAHFGHHNEDFEVLNLFLEGHCESFKVIARSAHPQEEGFKSGTFDSEKFKRHSVFRAKLKTSFQGMAKFTPCKPRTSPM
jgi:hypothetical protein